MQKHTIDAIRKAYKFEEYITDEEVDKMFSGSVFASLVELNYRMDEFKAPIVKYAPKWIEHLVSIFGDLKIK